jgi:hypothetical protein
LALSALQREGEGLFQIDLNVPDLSRATAQLDAVIAGERSALFSPSAACGIRLMVRSPAASP